MQEDDHSKKNISAVHVYTEDGIPRNYQTPLVKWHQPPTMGISSKQQNTTQSVQVAMIFPCGFV